MRRTWMAPLLVLALAAPALAQTGDFTPPPMVPSGPPPTPPNEPGVTTPPPTGTPPPPGAVPPSNYVPNAPPSGYQYSPYGQPQPTRAPGPEIGLMVNESLFGMLTGVGVSLLPYVFLFGYTIDPSLAQLGVLPEPIASVMLIVLFGALPVAVAQTQVGIANGSRFYTSEQWPAALSGLLAEAAVLGLFYLTGWIPELAQASGGAPRTGGSIALLLIGSVVAVPLIQMAVINLTKEPRFKASALQLDQSGRLSVGIPIPTPLVAQTREGTAVGVNLSLLSGRF